MRESRGQRSEIRGARPLTSDLRPLTSGSSILLHEQRQRGGIAVEEILFTDGADLAIAEEAGQAQRAKVFLHLAGIVARLAKEPLAASVATTKAAAIDQSMAQPLLGPLQ